MSKQDIGVEFEGVEVLEEREKAIWCLIDGEKHWIPKSQICADSMVQGFGDRGLLVIKEWLAKEKGLI